MMDDSFEYGSKKIKTEGELEVTGVSRSGRVRKKSSKLTDFESLDEIDMRSPKAKKEKQDYSIPLARSIKKEKIIKEEILTDEEEMDSGNFVLNKEAFIKQEVYSDESEPDLVYPTNDESSMDSLGSDMDDIEEPDIDREDTEGFQPIVGDSVDDSPTQSTSVYAMERSNKKKLVIKDGKIVGRVKAQRKDKGKTRFTAYMLWAKEIRSELTKQNPDLDFSQTSKKLGELWASVPFHEKYIWKRRAKRLAARGMAKQQQQQHQQTVAIPETKKMKSPPSRKFINKQSVSPATSNNIVLSPETKSNKGSTALDSGVFKPVGTTPLDVAAHLRLLGESLTIIGERLTEHEGQIAVSGSFSVLLDSLLCALGPLLCLTQQVPQLNVIPQEQLSQLMDNIAYIMPGL
ncbi:unnamed protein product [Nezara viridula]|uniref:HMG box domain-containing protein n=1 Tax=Nezara viridula TaxID=85310 RepID=A0A9P0H595_NEZVI|nr:unnamed protein product [Nezara viridula]